METGTVTAEARKLWPLLAKHLYNRREVFLREVVSNAADAVEKVRILSRADETLRAREGKAKSTSASTASRGPLP